MRSGDQICISSCEHDLEENSSTWCRQDTARPTMLRASRCLWCEFLVNEDGSWASGTASLVVDRHRWASTHLPASNYDGARAAGRERRRGWRQFS